MSAASVAARGRRAAEALMVDTCVARRVSGAAEQDSGTGTVEPTFTDLFTSACKVQERALVTLDAEVGGRTATVVRVELHLPVAAGVLRTGDVVEVTDSADTSLIGRKFTISGPVGETFGTARRYEVTEVVA